MVTFTHVDNLDISKSPPKFIQYFKNQYYGETQKIKQNREQKKQLLDEMIQSGLKRELTKSKALRNLQQEQARLKELVQKRMKNRNQLSMTMYKNNHHLSSQ